MSETNRRGLSLLIGSCVSVLALFVCCRFMEQSQQELIDEAATNVVEKYTTYASIVDDFDGQYCIQVLKEYPKGKMIVVTKTGSKENAAFFVGHDLQYKNVSVPMHNSPKVNICP